MISKLIKGLVLIALGWVACFYIQPNYKQFKRYIKKSFSAEQPKAAKPVYEVTENKPFVVVIPSYNNEAWCERNLRSVFEQKYDNFRIIYIDDASTDNTYTATKELIDKYQQQSKVTLIRNEKNLKAVENLYRAIHSCHDNEIVLFVDGDDWLANEYVLETLNRYYADPKVWLTYGNYIDYPTYAQGGCVKKVPHKVRHENTYRKFVKKDWIFSHLKTCYAGLFKQIKLEDVLHEGNFFASTYDQVFMLPLVEMASAHVKKIDEILYVYNRATILNDDKVNFDKQQACKNYVQQMPASSALTTFPGAPEQGTTPKSETFKADADLVVFSYDRPLQLQACLESIQNYASNISALSVIYRCSSPSFAQAYEKLKVDFPHVCWHLQSTEKDFKPIVLSTVFNQSARYVAFVVDDIIMKDHVNFAHCIEAMEKTGAYGFYLKLGTHVDYCYTMNCAQGVPPYIELGDQICAWQFNVGTADWKYPNSVDMTLYKKAEIEKDLGSLDFENPYAFESNWAKRANYKKVGLFYTHSKSVNIPLNIVGVYEKSRHMSGFSKEELLEKFNAGLKIDIQPFYQIENNAAHMEYEPKFIAQGES
jgi:hypothetical protein